jgi:hypothetical protein
MSDTVPASAIAASLGDSGPSFVLDQLGTGASTTGAAIGVYTSDFHVSGAVHSAPVSGFGSPLLVDFVTWNPAPTPTVAPPTVSGPGVAGGMHPDGLVGLPTHHATDVWGS